MARAALPPAPAPGRAFHDGAAFDAAAVALQLRRAIAPARQTSRAKPCSTTLRIHHAGRAQRVAWGLHHPTPVAVPSGRRAGRDPTCNGGPGRHRDRWHRPLPRERSGAGHGIALAQRPCTTPSRQTLRMPARPAFALHDPRRRTPRCASGEEIGDGVPTSPRRRCVASRMTEPATRC